MLQYQPGQTVSRTGTSDNNNLTDFTIVASTIGSTNTGMIIPFTGFGCESARIAVTATVTPAPAALVFQPMNFGLFRTISNINCCQYQS
ncbi:MAG: hypothetical protein IPK08_04370 [Bacteroidetes bacterium]|nr:hypothetical protein [Bacteroidota bacterium]